MRLTSCRTKEAFMSISQEESDLGFYIDKIGNKRFNFNKFAHYISYNYNLICVGEKNILFVPQGRIYTDSLSETYFNDV